MPPRGYTPETAQKIVFLTRNVTRNRAAIEVKNEKINKRREKQRKKEEENT